MEETVGAIVQIRNLESRNMGSRERGRFLGDHGERFYVGRAVARALEIRVSIRRVSYPSERISVQFSRYRRDSCRVFARTAASSETTVGASVNTGNPSRS